MADQKSLLPINATELEKALEQTAAKTTTLPILNQNLWNPELCPAPFLPWLGWAVSVDHWDSGWSDVQKRLAISQSILVHKEKGTISSIERVMATLGVQVELEEWFEFDGAPHTFKLTLWVNENLVDQDTLLSDALYRNLIQSIDRVKPVRSHYDFTVGVLFNSTMLFGSAATNSTYAPANMNFSSDFNFDNTSMNFGSAFGSINVVQAEMNFQI